MRHSQLCSSLIVSLIFTFICNRIEASLFYDFEDYQSGKVLATLELATLPASHTDVLGLTFTPIGQIVLMVGPTYMGVFDLSVNQFVSDGLGGLQSSDPSYQAYFLDYIDAPPTDFFVRDVEFTLVVRSPADVTDYFEIRGRTSSGLGKSFVFHGDFRLAVPDPLAGDFDVDGDVDGADFLAWQRAPSVGALSDWQANYGQSVDSSVASTQRVPEPETLVIACIALVPAAAMARRR